MEKLLSKIIISILEGKDYRPYVLATINKRFIDNVHALLERVYNAKKINKNIDWWITNLIEESKTKNEILWFGGLNNKTVTNMMGTTKKEVCIELSKQNVKSLEILIGSSCKSMGKLMNFKKYNMASNKEKRAFKGIKKSV